MAALIEEIASQHTLTEREKDVLHGIWNGHSNQEMADMFFISVNTVKFHVSRLYMKLDVKNRSELRSMKSSGKNGS
jgi:DNA-binding CsgD family transcriptional regulator